MPPELGSVTSFSLDIDDWHSCHTSDDEAYQDALERNSVASFYTARDNASSAASVVNTSFTLGSPSRLADADQALEQLILEKYRSSRMQHEPPELDEQETPACKRTRSLAHRFRLSIAASTRLPSPAVKAKFANNRRVTTATRTISPPMPGSPQNTEGAAVIQPGSTSTASVRVCINVLPDESAVQVRITPTIFCFGNVFLPAPTASTDYAAMLLGPEGGLTAEDSGHIEQQALEEHQLAPQPEPHVTDADRDVPLARRGIELLSSSSPSGAAGQRFHSSRNDPNTPKDQTKVKRQAEDKARKPGVGFPSSSTLVQKLFSGFRASDGGDGQEALPPVTVQELGSSLLLASAAGQPAGVVLAVAACQTAPMVAAYIHAAQAVPVPVPAVPAADVGAVDEAAIAAHRLSASIFRNVLRAAAGGAEEVSPPLPSISPRDTAFQPTETATPHRDQVTANRVPEEAECNGRVRAHDCGTFSPGRRVSVSNEGSPQQSPADRQQAPGFAALALLVGLASDAIPTGSGMVDSDKLSGELVVDGGPAVGRLGSNNASVEALDCSGLPMPELEQCESPVTRKAASPSATAPTTAPATAETVLTEGFLQEVTIRELREEPTEAAPGALFGVCVHAVPVVPVLAATAIAVASPRTVSKRAYGTVARLVKKMNPYYRDSAIKSTISMDLAKRPLPMADATSSAAPVGASEVTVSETPLADAAAACEPSVPSVAEGSSVNSSANAEESIEEDVNLEIMTSAAAEDSSVPVVEAQAAADLPAQDGGAPVMFVFGQEHARTAKPGKSRMSALQLAAPPGDAALTADAAGRKRKADVEILPTAKLPLRGAKASIDAEQSEAQAQPADVMPEAPAPSIEDQETATVQASLPDTDPPVDDSATGVANPDDKAPRPTVMAAVEDEVHAQVTTEVLEDPECANPDDVIIEAPCNPDETKQNVLAVVASETSTVARAVDEPVAVDDPQLQPSDEPEIRKPEQAVSVTCVDMLTGEQLRAAQDEYNERPASAEFAEALQLGDGEAGDAQPQPEPEPNLAAMMRTGAKEVTLTASTTPFLEMPPLSEAGVVVGVHASRALNGAKLQCEAQEVGAFQQVQEDKFESEAKTCELQDQQVKEALANSGDAIEPRAAASDAKPSIESEGAEIRVAEPAVKDVAVEQSETHMKTDKGKRFSRCFFNCFRR